MIRINERLVGVFEGGIEVVEAVPSNGGSSAHIDQLAAIRFAADVQSVADAAHMRTRGGEVVAGDLAAGRARYLLARTRTNEDGHDTPQPLASVRVTSRVPTGLFRAFRPALLRIEGLEAVSRILVPTEKQDTDDVPSLPMKAAAALVYAVASSRPDDSTIIQIEGRRPPNFSKGEPDPREEGFFNEIGFSTPNGMPSWNTEKGVLTGIARIVERLTAKTYSLTSPKP